MVDINLFFFSVYSGKKRKIDKVERVETPSPIRRILLPVKEAYNRSKNELIKTLAVSNVTDTWNAETELVPASLSANNITHDNAYRRLLEDDLINHNLSIDPNLDEVNNTAAKISELLLESIVLFDNHWVLVTEYELYIRNMKSIDDCAQDSFSRMYPSQVEVYEINKYEKGNAWVETVMFWDRFELLVTGGLRGLYSDNMIVPFLGSAVKALKPTNYDDENKTTSILVKYESTNFIQNTRKLRQYNKAAAMQKWIYQSSTYYRKGFCTTNPLKVHKDRSKVTMATVASFILSRIVAKSFGERWIY